MIVLGAGAAGLMAAMEAGRRGRRVVVLERAERAGKKILISGGGRCNFTNLHTRPHNFLSANPHFAKSALARYTPADFIRLVERHGIAYHEKTLGQLFCDGSAQQIVDLLMKECADAGVRVVTSATVREVRRDDSSGVFRVTAGEQVFVAPALVVATGGLSIPKMGATGFGYDIARQFGNRANAVDDEEKVFGRETLRKKFVMDMHSIGREDCLAANHAARNGQANIEKRNRENHQRCGQAKQRGGFLSPHCAVTSEQESEG